jgi:predicted enzyme related to lactoylglutathione lyase
LGAELLGELLQIVSPPYPEGTLRVALFADPAGNVLGIWQETAASLDSP